MAKTCSTASRIAGVTLVFGLLTSFAGCGVVAGFANIISDPVASGPSTVIGVRADGGNLSIALGGVCPAGTTYTVMFDRDNLTVNSNSKTMVFTSNIALTVFDPFHLPEESTVTTPFPAGFKWQDAKGLTIWAHQTNGTPDNETGASLSRVSQSSQYASGAYDFGNGWMTLDQVAARTDMQGLCGNK